MPRRPSAIKQGVSKDEPLHTREAWRQFLYGADQDMVGVLTALQMAVAAGDPSKVPAARDFLAGWLFRMALKKDGKRLRRLAAIIDSKSRGLFDAADPVAARLASYAQQCATDAEKTRIARSDDSKGEVIRAILKRVPIDQLMKALAAQGIKADETTVRRTLNRWEIKRETGRPKKPRHS